ncbi:MAG: hypothetical protein KAY24_15400 [Candidatus Eisenbacteria sp.]|nr:hypothetical protein [Candidatus Eisenbacteria bacterium]
MRFNWSLPAAGTDCRILEVRVFQRVAPARFHERSKLDTAERKDGEMAKEIFDIIILNGRPAAGKSEVIDYLKKTPVEERIRRFHIGEFEEFDDFPILWERFEDDDIYERHGKARLISNTTYEYEGETRPGYVFKDQFFWNFLIEKLNLFYAKRLRDVPNYHDTHTAIFEFARGSQHGGFAEAYSYLSDDVLTRASMIYIKVSWAESVRKNRRRYNPDKPDSILEHALEDKKIEFLYKESDWDAFSSKDPDHLIVGNHEVPYTIFDNEPEKTDKPEVLGKHLEEVCAKLWAIRQRCSSSV